MASSGRMAIVVVAGRSARVDHQPGEISSRCRERCDKGEACQCLAGWGMVVRTECHCFVVPACGAVPVARRTSLGHSLMFAAPAQSDLIGPAQYLFGYFRMAVGKLDRVQPVFAFCHAPLLYAAAVR